MCSPFSPRFFLPFFPSKAQLLQRPLPPRRRVVLAVGCVGVRRRKLREVFEAAALGVGSGGDVETGPWVRWGQRGGRWGGEGI